MRKHILFSKGLLVLTLCLSILCQLNSFQVQNLRRSQDAVITTAQTFESRLLDLIQSTPYVNLLDVLKTDRGFRENIWFQAYLEKLTSDRTKRHQKFIYAERLCSVFNLGREAESKIILAIQFQQAKSEWEERNGCPFEIPETENPARSEPFKEVFISKHGQALWNVLDHTDEISEEMKDRIALILILSNGTWGENNKQEVRKRMVQTLVDLGKEVEGPSSHPGAYKLMKLVEYFSGTKGIDMSVLWMNEDLKNSRYDNISVLYFARQLEEEGYQEIGIDGTIIHHTDIRVAAINFMVYFNEKKNSAEV
ncbi:MAG TPA: hypothetical protein ENN78_01400, partial [Candidatus Omnitrophica bacterium]|nr:hypothetical protein [Candidatus Omnitrophota bacterium]